MFCLPSSWGYSPYPRVSNGDAPTILIWNNTNQNHTVSLHVWGPWPRMETYVYKLVPREWEIYAAPTADPNVLNQMTFSISMGNCEIPIGLKGVIKIDKMLEICSIEQPGELVPPPFEPFEPFEM